MFPLPTYRLYAGTTLCGRNGTTQYGRNNKKTKPCYCKQQHTFLTSVLTSSTCLKSFDMDANLDCKKKHNGEKWQLKLKKQWHSLYVQNKSSDLVLNVFILFCFGVFFCYCSLCHWNAINTQSLTFELCWNESKSTCKHNFRLHAAGIISDVITVPQRMPSLTLL